MKWVMLRGLGRHSDHWGKFAELMGDEFDEIQCINLPGISSNDKNIPISISDIVDQIRDEFLKNKSTDDWSILAISLGGMVALDWVNRYPKDFKQIVTINSSTRSLSKFYERMQPGAIKVIAKAVFEKDVKKREKAVLELTCDMKKITEEDLDKAVEISNKMTIDKKIFAKQLFAATKFVTPDSLQTPYTVIAGAKDRLASVNCSKALANHFNAPIIIHPDAGHDLGTDDPEWLISEIKNLKNV